MLSFVRPRLTLLSVPKTGTTALEAALAPHAQVVLRARAEIKHITLSQYQLQIEPLLARIAGPPFRTVAVVREPVSWLGSWYRYRARPQLRGAPNSTDGISFDDFVTAYLGKDRPPYARLGRQSSALAPAPGRPPVDLLFRHTSMGRLVAFLSEELGTDITLQRLNVSPAGDLTLKPATHARLRAALADDFALWECAR